MRKNFTFDSAIKNCKINYYVWECDVKPIGVLQISHGMQEDGLRYQELAEELNKVGFIVVANDHLGHGKSYISMEQILDFKDGDGYIYVVQDIKTLHDKLKKKYPDLRHYILGFSLGSFLVRRYLQLYPNDVSAAIIMGTGKKAQAKITCTKIFNSMYRNVKDNKFKIKSLSRIRDLIKYRISDKFVWLRIDDETKKKYAQSPIGLYLFLIEKFYNMLGIFKIITNRHNVKKMNRNMPIFLLSGQDDIVGNYGKTVKELYRLYKKLKFKDVSIKLYKNTRHVILQSSVKDQVIDDIKSWLLSH